MELVKCPFCGKEIENDSFYCDQCGELLKVCPTHGFKKGKICSDCGTKLVDATDADITVAPSVTQQPVTQQPVTPPQSTIGGVPPDFSQDAAAEKTVRPTVAAEPKQLVSQQLNARLELTNQAIIGRKAGNFTAVFGSQNYVSGTHARLQQSAAGTWEIVDLDSSNGTFLNGNKLVPNQPAAFKIGDVIAFYDLKFVVE
ncbi:hypothetical protein AGMMS49982_13870 [Bacteroidia bacterium]|nr:hypothetical protein AGMMS49982_13870 [Bacteroidia bacterium]